MAVGRGHFLGRGGRARSAGFSLIELLFAAALLSVGVTALMVSARSATQVNADGADATQATYLAQEIREWTLKLPFSEANPVFADSAPGPDGSDANGSVDDLDDMMNVTYPPIGTSGLPRDASGSPIAGMEGWSQTIKLEWRDPASVLTKVADGSSDLVWVTVTVKQNGAEILTLGWFVTRRSNE
jgi:prepilin-type N-terminal cleavage/methylation domain-containing protein